MYRSRISLKGLPSVPNTLKKKSKKKPKLTKTIKQTVYEDGQRWSVKFGKLKRGKGRPSLAEHLFKVLGEKLPFECLPSVKEHVEKIVPKPEGVYVAHDSMGCPRYIGRGSVFARLASRLKARPLELKYFSFYLVSVKKHEREIETLLIRSASFLLAFNDRKKRAGISHGNIMDYEPGTLFYERQEKKGVKPRA